MALELLDLGHVHITPFSFRSVFATKNGAIFFLPVHIVPFLNKNG